MSGSVFATEILAPQRARRTAAASVALLIVALWAPVAHAAGPVDALEFDNPAQEARYQALIAEFRCPKCLNTNLPGSDAPIAKDLRRTVHRLLVIEGKSNDEIREFLQARYGDFVLYDPPFKPGTWLLWLGPVGFVIIGLVLLFRLLRQPPAEPLSAADVERVRTIIEDD